MTFSLIAHCAESGQFGVAATTAVPAVGKLVTHAWPGVGAVATQARVNPYLGIDGIGFLRQGMGAPEVKKALLDCDPHPEWRQFAVMDKSGRTEAWTGSECLDWAGRRTGTDLSVQGNRLAGPHVLAAMEAAFLDLKGEPLARRLIEAPEAGNDAGGDFEGAVSATIYIVECEAYPLWDIRVDDHPEPIRELHRLHDVFAERERLQTTSIPFDRFPPTTALKTSCLPSSGFTTPLPPTPSRLRSPSSSPPRSARRSLTPTPAVGRPRISPGMPARGASAAVLNRRQRRMQRLAIRGFLREGGRPMRGGVWVDLIKALSCRVDFSSRRRSGKSQCPPYAPKR